MSAREPVVIAGIAEWRRWCAAARARGTLGFVPTMGALHAGHASLVARSAAENAATAVSIFVNPAQFNDAADLAAYPRTVAADVELLRAAGAAAVFLPEPATMYPHGYRYRLCEDDLSRRLCGAHRPGHFDGVLTVVMKLLLLTAPHRAYLGEKDYQQLLLIRGMVRDFFLETEVVACATVREASGLAMSSRNVRLSAEGRVRAAVLHRALAGAADPAAAARELERQGLRVEYVEDLEVPGEGNAPAARRRLAAAWLEGVRLIDNVAIGSEGSEPR
jgi:pantoate--beta-alanine ligase